MTKLERVEVDAREKANPRKRNRKVRDLTGMRFNELTVVSRADDYVNPSGNRFVQWNCKCSCGKMCVKRGTALMSGKAKSCGHLRSDSNRGKGLIDLTGKKFGRWTVLSRSEDHVDARGKHWPMWLCRCECGTEKVVNGASLRAGGSRSCGCYKTDTLSVTRDLVGTEFGRLTVRRQVDSSRMYGRLNKMWECVCACGNIAVVREPDLLNGSVRSCGCLGKSASEELFEELLDARCIRYERQKTYAGLSGIGGKALRFDFFLDVNDGGLVELNGVQHYHPVGYFGGDADFEYQKANYGRKVMFAAENDIPLFEVDCSGRPSKKELAKRLDDIVKMLSDGVGSSGLVSMETEAYRRLGACFGMHDVGRCPFASQEVYRIKSRNLFVAILGGIEHGWHWNAEDGREIVSCEFSQIRESDEELRQVMESHDANFVAFWDKSLEDMSLWFAMGAPDGKDWVRSYSWLPSVDIGPITRPHAWKPCATHSRVAKHYQHEVFYRRELDLWSADTFLDKRSDKRRVSGMYFSNRFKYLGKLPYEMTNLELLRGLSIAGIVRGYSSYNSKNLASFLETHSDVRRVVDPCAGWGERMLCCAAHDVAYSGVDANVALEDGYARMVGELGLVDVDIRYADAAKCDYDAADAVVTCPPYRNAEVYSDCGAENLTEDGFAAWWEAVVKRVVASGCRYFCITTNQSCKELFSRAIENEGFSLIDAVAVNRNSASHFQRKGGVKTKREYEEFLVFVRDGNEMQPLSAVRL